MDFVQVTFLAQLTELLVRKEPSLLQEFLPETVKLQVRRWYGAGDDERNGHETTLAGPQVDQSPMVRKAFVVFLGEASRALPTASILQNAASCASALLKDTSVMVVKAALLAGHTIFRLALALLGSQASPHAHLSMHVLGGRGYLSQSPCPSGAQPDDTAAQACWETARGMQQVACSLVAHPGGNDSVRLSAIKLLEGFVLLLSSENAPSFQGRCWVACS